MLSNRVWTLLLAGLAAAGAWAARLVRKTTFLSHMAAGIAGAALTLAVGASLGLLGGARHQVETADQAHRLAAAEAALAQQSASLPANAAARLAAAEQRLAGIEQQAKAIAALRETQAKLAAETQALKAAATSSPEVSDRIAKLESAMAGVAADQRTGSAPSDVAAITQETTSLRQGLDALKGTVEQQVTPKLAAVERELQVVRKSEGERIGGAQQSLLTLEIANLKRALDRGDSFAAELDAAKKAAGSTFDLSGLERAAATGVPTLPALTQNFRRISDAAIDAEADEPNASALDRLIAGARSVVRVRKTEHDPGDTSAEATLWRMETALKNGDIGEALAQGKRLPPKAARAAEDWLRHLEARHAADRTVAEAEAVLRASLTRRPAVAEPPR